MFVVGLHIFSLTQNQAGVLKQINGVGQIDVNQWMALRHKSGLRSGIPIFVYIAMH